MNGIGLDYVDLEQINNEIFQNWIYLDGGGGGGCILFFLFLFWFQFNEEHSVDSIEFDEIQYKCIKFHSVV